MKSFMQKKETVERKWYVIDAEGKSLGRVASLHLTLIVEIILLLSMQKKLN